MANMRTPARSNGSCTGYSHELYRAAGHQQLFLPARRQFRRRAVRAGQGAGPRRPGGHRPQFAGRHRPGVAGGQNAWRTPGRRLPAGPEGRHVAAGLPHGQAGLVAPVPAVVIGQAAGRQGQVRSRLDRRRSLERRPDRHPRSRPGRRCLRVQPAPAESDVRRPRLHGPDPAPAAQRRRAPARPGGDGEISARARAGHQRRAVP